MKTTKKDWIYRVILLILLAIIWDIGAALTSPICSPERRCVSGILPVDPKWNNVESIPIFAGSHYGGSRFECRHLHSSWLSDENLSSASKAALSSNSSNAVFASHCLLSTVDYVVWNRRENEDRFLICSQLCVHASKRSDRPG